MVHIFYMNLSGDCSYEQSLALYKFLPEERKRKVKSAKQEDVARNRLYTGAFLQYVLSEETGIPMENISYVYGEQGKPEIDYRKLEELPIYDTYNIEEKIYTRRYFNLSHSGEYVVLAVSDRPVGIDIEYKKRNFDSVAKRCFCKSEYNDNLKAAALEDREQRFLQYWTMKEAFIKHSGEGLSVPLNSFQIVRGDTGISYVEDGQVWFFSCFWGEKPYCISLCSESEQDVRRILEKNRETDFGLKQVTIGNICHGI